MIAEKQARGFILFFLLLAARLHGQLVSGPQFLALDSLENGLHILAIQDTTLSTTTWEVSVFGGSFPQAKGEEGVSHLLEHAFFRANPQFPEPDSLRNYLIQKGIVFFGETESERNSFKLQGPPGHSLEMLQILSVLVISPEFGRKSISQASSEIAAELQTMESQPFFHLSQEVSRRLWGTEASRKNLAGTFRHIRNASPELLSTWHRSLFFPKKCILAVASPDPISSMVHMADSLFGHWGTEAPHEIPSIPFLPEEFKPGGFTLVNEFVDHPELLVSWVGPGILDDPQQVMAGTVLAEMLTLKRGGLFQKTQSSELFGDLECEFFPSGFPASFVLHWKGDFWGLQPGMDSLFSEIRRWVEPGYFSPEELEIARLQIYRNVAFQRAQTSFWMDALSSRWVAGGTPFLLQFDSLLASVSLMDIETFARNRLPLQKAVGGLTVPSGIGEELNWEELWSPTPTLPTEASISQGPAFHLDTLRVFFLSGMKGVDPASFASLDLLGQWLKVHPDKAIYLNSYSESKGDGVENYHLSIQRGRALMEYMVGQYKLNPSQIELRAYGEAFPEYPERPFSVDQKNRRASFSVKPQGGGGQ